jgi:hypothetical protein
MSVEHFTIAQLQEFLTSTFADDSFVDAVWDQINVWFERGDGIAIYENVDLGHYDLGHVKFASFGSPAAQLEVDEPPQTLPDIGGQINYRYYLKAVYRPEIYSVAWGEGG